MEHQYSIATSTKKILKLFLTIVLLEIVIGGGGRFIELGPLSLKMLFFIFSMGITIILARFVKANILLQLQYFLIIILAFGTVVGISNGASSSLIVNDIKPLLFFFIMSFFSLVINNYDDIIYVSKIIKKGALALAFTYFAILILLYLGFIDFTKFYVWGNEVGEIFFREGNFMFFYKGFLYLCIGFFFHLILAKTKRERFFAFLMFLAVCLTLSRGLILMTTIVFAFYVFFISKSKALKFFSVVTGVVSVIYLLPIYFESLGDKTAGDQIRIDTFNEVVERIDIFSIFIGHGLGIGVPTRLEHMEMTYLEVFHKQGIIGLSFFVVILFLNFYFYSKITTHRNIALAFLLAVCFVYLQSFTNPFVNNPIGISIVALSLVVMYKMYATERFINKEMEIIKRLENG